MAGENWRVEVHLITGTEDYATELIKVLERVDVTDNLEVFPASQIVILDNVTKNVARTVATWTLDFWGAAYDVRVRKNLLTDEPEKSDGGTDDTHLPKES